ncbi:hypothetical protein KIH74_17430 [Kineosporia sp. J2-2]|uniref:Peptidase M14 domain-containing protein n=1 Tax=Kineosporia corallincola TaxID=2835133 RepID=A0ABS5TI11_9ACTN|nr:M14 family zinc carboxypeptidase [Kineosporia corallincola]MBT0770730.1 hypothetical protein [Kineosporia corallincola]
MTLPAWLLGEIATVPAYDGFAGVDELDAGLHRIAGHYPEVASLSRCGSSGQGHPIWCLTVDLPGDVPEALAYGLPHPNEPIGGLTALHLAERLCADAGLRERLGHRWRIVACADPDGLRLNEGWLRGPFTRAHYSRHFYRPAGRDQVEWTFPINHEDAYFDEVLPETQALMRVMDEHRPALVASLHNSELGGAYYWMSRAEPDLHPVLQQIPVHLGIPLHRGEGEADGLEMLGEAIYEAAPLEKVYARSVADGGQWVQQGGSSTWYCGRWNALMLVSELPYWLDPAADDTRASGVGHRDALLANAERLEDAAGTITGILADVEGHLMAPASPFWRATRFYAGFLAEAGPARRARAGETDPGRIATVAEANSLDSNVHEWRLRYGGILRRALRGEVAVGNLSGPVRSALAEIESRYETWLAADHRNAELAPIEINRLVGVQYAATVSAAAHLAGKLD